MDGNDGDLRLTIGQLARRTGLSVKTIRWYSDQGLVPPAGRTASGYRLFGVEDSETGTGGEPSAWQLLGIINGWPPIPSVVPAFEWVIAALCASG
jgi:hypothetical protein